MKSADQQEFVKRHPFEPMPGEKGMNLDQLIEAGLVKPEEVTTQGAYLALLGLMKSLKARRQAKGLSLAAVSDRSGLTRPVISALENGKTANPTLETLYRYASALDATIGLTVEDVEAED
jgi:DNA-binding XRE family transcriptional regulator